MENFERDGCQMGIKLIQGLYKGNMDYLLYKKMKSEEFDTKEGLTQGGLFCPLLFIIHFFNLLIVIYVSTNTQKPCSFFVQMVAQICTWPGAPPVPTSSCRSCPPVPAATRV